MHQVAVENPSRQRSSFAHDRMSELGAQMADIRRQVKHQKKQRKQRRLRLHYWLSAEEEMEAIVERRGAASWQHRLVGALQTHRAQLAIVVLLVLDVLIIFIEIYMNK